MTAAKIWIGGAVIVLMGSAISFHLGARRRSDASSPTVPQGAEKREAARPVEAEVREYLAPLLKMRDFSGVVRIESQTERLANQAYGFANFELEVPSETSTRYGIGSISKTFTAAAILLLAEEGRLSLDDKVARFLPDLPYGGRITIEQLLAHQAGVPDYYAWPEYAQNRSQPMPLPELVTLIGHHPLAFAPGSQSSYSNSGYALLAAVIERASGRRYADYLRYRLFDPLAMNDTGDLSETGITPRLATGYNPGFAPARLQPPVTVHPSWLEGSGSLYSTAGDLLRWAEALRSGTPLRLDHLPYPYGWGERDAFGRKLWEQNGRVPIGYTSYLGLFPADGLVVIVLSNIQVDVAERLGRDFAAMALGEKYEAPEVRGSTPVKAALLEEYVGRYEIAPGFPLAVRAEGEHLALAGPEGDFLPLEPLSEERFFFRALYVTVTFERDRAGRVVGLNWNDSFRASRKG